MRIRSLMTDDVVICRAVMRISHDILKRGEGTQGIEAALSTCGTPEIRNCRDDLTFKQETPCARLSAHPSISQNKTDLFVEYAVNTSRTIWAAIDAAFLTGLPKPFSMHPNRSGHRKCPSERIYGNYIKTAKMETVSVCMPVCDDRLTA